MLHLIRTSAHSKNRYITCTSLSVEWTSVESPSKMYLIYVYDQWLWPMPISRLLVQRLEVGSRETIFSQGYQLRLKDVSRSLLCCAFIVYAENVFRLGQTSAEGNIEIATTCRVLSCKAAGSCSSSLTKLDYSGDVFSTFRYSIWSAKRWPYMICYRGLKEQDLLTGSIIARYLSPYMFCWKRKSLT